MQIDPTKWPKVQGDKFPENGYYAFTKNGNVTGMLYFTTKEDLNHLYSYYGPIEFVPPKVIPPKPDSQISFVELRCGDNIEAEWCVNVDTHFYPLRFLNWKTGWHKDMCKIIEQ